MLQTAIFTSVLVRGRSADWGTERVEEGILYTFASQSRLSPRCHVPQCILHVSSPKHEAAHGLKNKKKSLLLTIPEKGTDQGLGTFFG